MMYFRVLAPVQIIKESWQLYCRLMVTVFSRVNTNCLMLSTEFQREVCYHKYEELVLQFIGTVAPV